MNENITIIQACVLIIISIIPIFVFMWSCKRTLDDINDQLYRNTMRERSHLLRKLKEEEPDKDMFLIY